MTAETHVVDDRTFLLGLDELYRRAMKPHERGELLDAARETAAALSVAPATGPVEGYYAEDEALTEYFQLVRALQDVSAGREPEVAGLPGYRRLREVTGSPLFGPSTQTGDLLPAGKDPLSRALGKTFPDDWAVETLTAAAYAEAAADEDDCSLVALAALARDAVPLAALRETAVLYAAVMAGGSPLVEQQPEYIWSVDETICERAARFVATFNTLFDERLPAPVPEHAERYGSAAKPGRLLGRCVRIGLDDRTDPPRQYHWALRLGAGGLEVHAFWDEELWTTERYRETLFETF
ncbi:hypothetical protein [Alienimonas sp. DA493]|uniref:hypothetical protein n=1 Tax=Alienimonas sp. DA493 TaxID=3373605 RepID=UPI0037549546